MRTLPYLLALLAMSFVAPAMAETALENWRIELNRVRGLAENDIPYAYREAQRLQAATPAGANAADRTHSINLLARIEVYMGETSTAERHIKEAFELARSNGDRIGQAEADLSEALNSVNMGRFDALERSVTHAMEVLAGVERPDLLAEAMLRSAMMFRRFDRFEDFVEMAMQTLDIAQRSKNPAALIHGYRGMASAYEASGQYAAARDYYQKMSRAARESHSRLLEGDALLGLASVLRELGDAKTGERLIRDALKLYRIAGGPFYLAHAHYALSENLYKQRRLKEALSAISETIAVYERYPNRVGMWWALGKRGQIARELGQLSLAQKDADHAYKLASELGMTIYVSESLRMRAENAAAAGDYYRAYSLSQEATRTATKNAMDKAVARMLDLAKRYEYESRQRQVAELTRTNEMQNMRQRWLWSVLGGSVALLVISVLFLFHLRRSREAVRKLNASLEQRISDRTLELQQSRQLLSEAQRITHVGSWELEHRTKRLTWSDEIYRIFETEQGHFGGTYQAFLDAVHPDDRERVGSAFAEALRKHVPYEIEHRLSFPDGRVKYVQERCETHYSSDGMPERSIGTVQDITERKLAEQKLKEALEFADGIINAIPDILLEIDRDGRYLNVWTQKPELLAAQREALLGKTCHEVLSPEAAAAAMDAIHEADENGLAQGKDICIDLPQGRRWFSHTLSKKTGGTPGEVTFLAVSRDITERKQLEEALAARERNFRSLTENLPDSIARWDTQGRYLYINPTHAHTLGVEVGDIAGTMLPETHDRVRAALAQVVATGQAIALVRQPVQVNGEMQIHEVSLAPEYDAEGCVVSIVGLGRDMTAMYRMQEIIAAREHEFRSLAESSPGMMGSFYLKPGGSMCMPYVSSNIQELFGLHPQDVAEDAAALMKLTHPDDAQRVLDSVIESARTMKPWHCEYRIQHPTKGERWMESNSNPQPHPDGGTIWYGYVHDVTERKRMEAALKESEARYRYNSNLLQAIIESPSSSVSIYALDREYRFLAFNSRFRKAAKRLWNADIELGMSMLDAIDNETHREFSRRGFDHILAGNHGFLESNEMRIEDGRKVNEYHDNYGSPIYNDNGEVIGMTVFVLNTTERKEAEQKLKEALEFSEGVINAIPDLLFEMSSEGRYLNIWTHTPELLASQREVLLGKTVSEMLLPESAVTIMEVLRDAEEHGVSIGKLIRVDLPQGESWFELSASKKSGNEPASNTFLVLARDVTGRKRMEAALSESEARLRALIDNLPFEFWAMDNSLRYIMQNATSLKNYGNLLGKRIEDLGLPPEVAATRIAQDRKVLAGQILQTEYEKEAAGERRYYESLAAPVVLCDTVIGIVGVGIDITARKQLEAELQASRNFLDSVIDSVSDPIFVKDRQHRWTLLNDAFCTFIGHPRTNLLGKSDYDFFPNEQADVFWEKDEFVFESGEINLNEESFTSANGETHFIQTKKTPFVSAEGEQMLVGVIRDITERQRFEAAREAALIEAQRLAKLRSDFIAHMSHELRTPLNGVLGYAQMLERNGKLDEKQFASVEVIRQSGEHLLALIEDILDLARIESGKLELNFSDIPLQHFLQVVVSIISIRAKQKKLEFLCKFAPDLPQGIRGDEKRLRQVLLNLLANAVKFTNQGKVTLSVSRATRSKLAFAVTDTGIGIAAADIEAIFQPFEQVGDVRHRDGGTGLGLAISRQLIRLMGGEIAVESRVGKGSTFLFELELPEAEISLDAVQAVQREAGLVETSETEEISSPLIAPPEAEMLELHRLALLGNMRDIANYAGYIGGLDPRYQSFAKHLKQLAEAFKSKAILAFVERHLQ